MYFYIGIWYCTSWDRRTTIWGSPKISHVHSFRSPVYVSKWTKKGTTENLKALHWCMAKRSPDDASQAGCLQERQGRLAPSKFSISALLRPSLQRLLRCPSCIHGQRQVSWHCPTAQFHDYIRRAREYSLTLYPWGVEGGYLSVQVSRVCDVV